MRWKDSERQSDEGRPTRDFRTWVTTQQWVPWVFFLPYISYLYFWGLEKENFRRSTRALQFQCVLSSSPGFIGAVGLRAICFLEWTLNRQSWGWLPAPLSTYQVQIFPTMETWLLLWCFILQVGGDHPLPPFTFATTSLFSLSENTTF